MKDEDKTILESLATAIPKMTEFGKGYLLGIAESRAEKRKEDECKDPVAV